MLLRMVVLKTRFTFTLIATLLIVTNTFAQVSNVEGIQPMDGIEIPNVQISQPQTAKPGAVFKDCDDCPEMVVIPQDINQPSFAIGKYEITQNQWIFIMGSNPSKNKGSTLPVENVSWDDVIEFLRKLSIKTGNKYRLPSSAEWDSAAGLKSSYQSFANEIDKYGWIGLNSELQTHPVGLKKPNRYGLYDLVGNVWEWVQDCRSDCTLRMQKGGSYLATKDIDIRGWSFANQNKKESTFGFRVARDL